ncbi:MAG: bacillithiol biosynthesis cysteine-adding enzyme BshC [Fluviicola sp.]
MNQTSSKEYINRSEIKAFSEFSANFHKQELYSDFLQASFTKLEDLNHQIQLKKQNYSDSTRTVLVQVLNEQLASIASSQQKENLELLAVNTTYTVTTGHQLSLFASPLFFVYKILHVAKLAKDFNEKNSENKIVPIFWLASEDHDFDEVKSTQLFGKKITWNSEQSGAVGRFNLNDFKEVFSVFSDLFAGKEAEINDLLESPNDQNYGSYLQVLVSKLFAQFGVLVLNPDDKRLKQLFSAVIKKELLESPSFKAVEQTNKRLIQASLSPQAQAREVNLFYLSEGKRTRIEKVGIDFKIGSESFSQDKMLQLVEQEPEIFSPNVILRPVYQEMILPNLCYVGGGGEMAYWIQLKGVFEAMNVVFPLIQQRVSLHLIDSAMQKRISALPFEYSTYFEDPIELKKRFLAENAEENVDFSTANSKFIDFQEVIKTSVLSVDQGLESWLSAEMTRMQKQLETIEQRTLKQVKVKYEQQLKNIEFVSERFLPERTLQERYFHFLHFVPSGNYSELFEKIYAVLDPFEERLIVLAV